MTTASCGCSAWPVSAEDRLSRSHAPEVDCDQHGCEGIVDQREVDHHVNIVESVLQVGEAYGYRDSGEAQPRQREDKLEPQRGRRQASIAPQFDDHQAYYGDEIQETRE